MDALKEIACDERHHRIQIELTPLDPSEPRHSVSGHYAITPYTFRPRVAKKLLANPYHDMGQGLLACLEELYEQEGLGDRGSGSTDGPAERDARHPR